jgi:hypothetical protein
MRVASIRECTGRLRLWVVVTVLVTRRRKSRGSRPLVGSTVGAQVADGAGRRRGGSTVSGRLLSLVEVVVEVAEDPARFSVARGDRRRASSSAGLP